MHKHADELQDRFADSALYMLMDQYAQEDGDILLQEYRNNGPASMPDSMELHCRKTIQKAYHRTVIGSALRRAARWVACAMILFTFFFPLAMHVEAFRIPVINYILKFGKGFTQITFTQDPVSFDSSDLLIQMVTNALPDGYMMNLEHRNTYNDRGVETVTSLLLHLEHSNQSRFQVVVTKAAGSINIDSQDSVVTEMDLLGQPAILVTSADELKILWINEEQKLLYNITAYDTQPDIFWAFVHALSEEVVQAGTRISF